VKRRTPRNLLGPIETGNVDFTKSRKSKKEKTEYKGKVSDAQEWCTASPDSPLKSQKINPKLRAKKGKFVSEVRTDKAMDQGPRKNVTGERSLS